MSKLIINNEDKGGKLLASGSSSCIFKPSIPCKNSSDEPNNNKLSKIIYGSKSNKYFNREKKMNSIINNIDGYKSWCLIFDTFCKPPTYDNIFKLYDENITDCLDEYYEEKFNDTSNMMIGDYGGITFEEYFINEIIKNKSKKNIDIHVYSLFKKMKRLFIGLNKLYNNNISHLDIKTNNIVLHNNTFKYIDFGFSSKLNDPQLKNRSLSEYDTHRYYLWYPIEYIFSYTTEKELNNELYDFNSKKYRKHYEKGIKIYNLFNRNFKHTIESVLYNNNNNINHNNLNSMIDTYSLGILLPFLFVDYNITKFINKSKFIKDIFKLFSEMCEPDHEKRIKPNICLKKYNELLKKYSSLDKSKKLNKSKKKSKKLSKRIK